MIITKKYVPRRTVLKGLGVTIALPLIDSMVPAFAAIRETATARVRRLGAIYVGNGMNMIQWTPPAEGALQLSPTLQPLAPFRDHVLVVTGLDNTQGDGTDGGPHPRMQTAWLTGARPKKTEGVDIRAGVSMDQIVAKEFGKETQLASLELATESVDLLGTCFLGYSCAYNNTISWRTPTTPLPMENNPRAVFERLFGASDSTDPQARRAYIRRTHSILDSVTREVAHFESSIGPRDRMKIAEYLDAVRDVERRIQKADEQQANELPVVDQPMGIPNTFEEHTKLMYDLLALAYQTDLTRVGTFLMVREASVRSYPEIGIPDSHHPLSHHQNNPEKLAKQAKLNLFHMRMFAYFLEKLRATPDGDGSLLDHTLLLYGCGMSDSNLHHPKGVPTLVAGGKQWFQVHGGRHLRCPEGTPLANLQLTLLEKLGLPVERFGDSTGELKLLSDV